MGEWLVIAVCAALGASSGSAVARVVLVAPQRDRPWTGVRRARPSVALRRGTSLVASLCAGLSAAAAGWAADLPAFLVLGLGCAALALVDGRTHRLPDRLTGPLAVALIGLLLLAVLGEAGLGDWARAVASGAAVLIVLGSLAFLAPAGIGLGDVKLAAVLGVALGWRSWICVPVGLFCGFLIGAVVALGLLIVRRASLRSEIPFGPSLIAGALITLAASGVSGG